MAIVSYESYTWERRPARMQTPKPLLNRGNKITAMTSDVDPRHLFEKEISRLMNCLYGTALRLTQNESDAEDLVAETVAKAWEKLDYLQDQKCFKGWIMRILSNLYIDNLRRTKPEISLVEEVEPADNNEEDFPLYARLHQPFLMWWGTPEKTFVNDLLREDIERAMDALPENYRIVVLMVEVLGHQYTEAANLLGVPVGTVRSRLNRGRRMLQSALYNQAREAGLISSTNPSGRVKQ